jgi:hypothetical protein
MSLDIFTEKMLLEIPKYRLEEHILVAHREYKLGEFEAG